MSVYFNENDKFAAQWLRNLYPKATVDERSIKEVTAADVAGHERCHFFGGIGGWEYALELAGWSGPVWTGSCPCQPFSDAGKQLGEKDERHLWPEFYRLISERRPVTIFGEQVASSLGREWLDGVSLDLEELDYAIGSSDLCAPSVGAPHIRQRLFWVADSSSERLARWALESARQECQAAERSGGNGRMGDADGAQRRSGRAKQRKQRGAVSATGSPVDGLADTERDGGRIVEPQRGPEGRVANQWADSRVVACRDEKARRISAQPGDEPLAYGIPRDLGRRIPELRSVAKSARSNRVGRLRGYGNAIVPQVAAVFIRSFMEATN